MPLKELLNNPWIFKIGSIFAFFVLTTSYIALALAFLDFLADGLKVKKVGIKKIGLCLAIFTPPTIIALLYPGIFIKALEYAGGISCADSLWTSAPCHGLGWQIYRRRINIMESS